MRTALRKVSRKDYTFRAHKITKKAAPVSSCTGAMLPYIGSKISLISNAEIRYEGTLYTINTEESTIALQNVKSFGTEGRKKPEVPKSNEMYQFT